MPEAPLIVDDVKNVPGSFLSSQGFASLIAMMKFFWHLYCCGSLQLFTTWKPPFCASVRPAEYSGVGPRCLK